MKLIRIIPLIILFFAVQSCKKNNCETCTKTIGGFAGTDTMEQKEVCDPQEIKDLEASSSGTTIWDCK